MTFFINPAKLREFKDRGIVNVLLRDDVDREYLGDSEQVRLAILALC